MKLAREAVGPQVPVLATVDLHANISRRMVECADCILSYRTNPHIDRRERGAEAAPLIRRLLVGERWEKTFIRMPIVPPSVTLLTARVERVLLGNFVDPAAAAKCHATGAEPAAR